MREQLGGQLAASQGQPTTTLHSSLPNMSITTFYFTHFTDKMEILSIPMHQAKSVMKSCHHLS